MRKRTRRTAMRAASDRVQRRANPLLDPEFQPPPAAPLTLAEVRRRYAPARTLGAPEAVQMALDSQLAESGAYSLIQHAAELGQTALPQFVGYSALQGLSQNGLIRACVETVTDDMTREGIELNHGAGSARDDRLIADLQAEMARLNLKDVFHHAAELVGYEGGALIHIDTGADGADLLTPLVFDPMSAELTFGGVKRFTVIDPVNVFPGNYNSSDPLRADYYRPQTWWILGRQVHASRLIRLVANECPTLLKPAYNFFGIPQAQILWDYVLHFQECRTAVARLLTKFSTTVFKTNLSNVLYSAAGTTQLDRRVQYFAQNRDNDGIAVIDKETEDIVKLETPLGGVTDIVRQSLELLAALNRTPAVKLLGISPSGFNATGESDLRNYYDHVRSQQEKVMRAGIARCLDALQLSLRGVIDDTLTFEFTELSKEDKTATAAYQKAKAETAAVYVDRGILSPEEVRHGMADDPDSGYSGIDPEESPETQTQGLDFENDSVYPDREGAPTRAGAGGVMGMDFDGFAGDKAKPLPEGWRWITTSKGRRVLIDENGDIQAGLGGKFDGKNISELGGEPDSESPSGHSGSKPHTYTAAELDGETVTSKTGKTFIRVPSSEKFCDVLQTSREANNIVDSKNTWRVSAPDAEEFANEHPNAQCFVTPGGSAFAVSDSGDIVSVCLCPGDVTIGGGDLVRMAIEHGGKKLDSFTGNHEFYRHMGFEPVSLCPWNGEFAPDLWKKGRDNPENIIFYKYTGIPDNPEWDKDPKNVEPLLPYFDDYGEAMAFRDARLAGSYN